jgi:hypothetical protein
MVAGYSRSPRGWPGWRAPLGGALRVDRDLLDLDLLSLRDPDANRVRATRVAGWLARQGVQGVYNLAEGIDAWSERVDPGVPRY